MNTLTKVAFIGTGAMGRPMIFKLLEKGYPVQVYDKYKEAADTVVAAGAIWTDTPAEAARGCGVVITCLPLPHHVLENMLGENGAIEGMQPGSTWIDTSTTDYHNTKYIAGVAAKRGIYSLEAPVSNLSHMGVDFANVSFYVSGDREGYELSKDVLNTMGQISFFVNENIGKAQTVKLLTNLLFYTGTILVGEVLMVAYRNGIPLHWMWDFIRASRGCSFVAEQVSPFILDGSYDRSCTLEITVKDTDLTVKLADELNVPMPIGRIVEERYRQAGEKYDQQLGHVTVTKLIEEENNLRLRVVGFTAPSPYGANPNYVHSKTLVEDRYGRIKPLPYQLHYDPPPSYDLAAELVELAETLTEFMAYVNYVILQEAYQLGKNMGLSRALLTDVVRWSCGTSWVFDNEGYYQPDPRIVRKIKQMDLGRNAIIPYMTKMIDALLEEPMRQVA
ncbi:NAD(P)-dependent oxidoreductase [Phormidium sp. CCY1219]|uniref:NAD(P)-dependent oxidoreductase n=1 Tax=Phormidium sp. CCY1219 TaxID=2886104 RepID=UPI002D1E7257|nr:NAD(P)-dependent oxidoreductase [Phormidium sp. CCY1219]MEB3830841.1 NAD(P)-dependent oxidoreductase [Phormidium sp. CCY1219]